MLKADVLSKLDEYKGRPVQVGLSDEGICLFGNIDNHWLFIDGDNLVEVKTNTSIENYGTATINQQQSPFVITTVSMDNVVYVRSFIKNDTGDISTMVGSLTPVGTDKSLDEIIKELEGNTVRKAMSPHGNLNTPDVNTKGVYGAFKGSVISTESDGIPKYLKDDLLNK